MTKTGKDGKKRRGLLGPFLVLLLELFGAGLAGLLVLGGLLAWRLSEGPLVLASLAPYLVEGINQAVAPYKVELGKTALNWGGKGPTPVLEAADVRILTPEGQLTAQVPRLQIRLSLPALMLGRPAPSFIRLVGPHLRAVRLDNGQVRLALTAQDDSSGELTGGGVDFINQWLTALAKPPMPTSLMGALRGIEIDAASLELVDYQNNVRWKAPRMDLVLGRNSEGMAGAARLEVAMGPQNSVLEATLHYERSKGELAFETKLDRLNPGEMASWAEAFKSFAPFDVPLSGVVRGTWAPNVGLKTIAFDLAAGGGSVPGFEEGSKLPVSYVKLEGSFDRLARAARLDGLTLDFNGPRLTLLADAKREGDTVQIAATAKIENAAAADLGKFWPVNASANAREWVTKNITGGMVSEAVAVAMLSLPLENRLRLSLSNVEGSMKMREVTVHYFRPLPEAKHVDGSARFDLGGFYISVEKGEVEGLELKPSTINLVGLRDDTDRAEIDAAIAGPLGAQLALLDHEPLGYAKRLGLEASKAGGRAATRLKLAFPLLNDLPIEQVGISAASTMTRASLPQVVAGQDLSEGTLNLTLDGAGMDVVGTGKVGGAPSTFKWREEFLSSKPLASQVSFTTKLDEAARLTFGLSWPEVVGAEIAVDGTYVKPQGKSATVKASLDLTPAELALPWIGWRKAAGTEAKGAVEIAMKGGSIDKIPAFSVLGAGLETKGSVSFAAKSKWDKITLASLTAPGSKIKGTIQNRGEAGPKMQFSGPYADVRGLFEKAPTKNNTMAAVEPETQSPFDVSFTIDKLVTGEKKGIKGAAGRLARDGVDWQFIDITGRLTSSNMPILVRLTPVSGGRTLILKSDDAGGMLAALHLMDKIRGGRLSVEGRGEGAGPVKAFADIRDFVYVEPKTIKKLATAADPKGSDKVGKDERFAFQRFKSVLVYDKGVLEVRDGRLIGDMLGMTLEGVVDLKRERLDLNGTFVPLYGVNSLVSGIPILGWILAGGEGQGVFAVTYNVKGPLSEPSTSVNPLSALAPGFLRNLFFAGKTKRPD